MSLLLQCLQCLYKSHIECTADVPPYVVAELVAEYRSRAPERSLLRNCHFAVPFSCFRFGLSGLLLSNAVVMTNAEVSM